METRWQSERVRRMEASATIDLGDRVKRLREEGHEVLNLISGAPEFDTPAAIKREAHAALDEDYRFMTYSQSAGLPELRRVIAAKLERENGIAATAEAVIVTVGIKQGIALAAWACLEPGDEVLILTPGWVTYDALVRIAGATPVSVPVRKEAERLISRSDLANAISARTRAVIVNSPHNPTGRVFGRLDLEVIAEAAQRYDLLVLSDETLEHLVYGDTPHVSIASLAGMPGRTLTFNGFSKAFSMAGWRVGYVHGPSALIANLLKVHQHLVTCANVVAQRGALAALESPAVIRAGIFRELALRREMVAAALDSVPGIRCPVPEAGLFCFPDIARTGMNDRDFARFCLDEARVAVLPGSAFGAGGEGHVRVAFTRRSTDALAGGIARIRTALTARDASAAGVNGDGAVAGRPATACEAGGG